LSLPDSRWDFSFVPFALLLFTAWAVQFKTPAVKQATAWQAALVWLALPFLGYNFVVALGLTHIYTTVPAWALLAALGWVALEHVLPWPHLCATEVPPRPVTQPYTGWSQMAWLLALFFTYPASFCGTPLFSIASPTIRTIRPATCRCSGRPTASPPAAGPVWLCAPRRLESHRSEDCGPAH
jgi:hypothetical protein